MYKINIYSINLDYFKVLRISLLLLITRLNSIFVAVASFWQTVNYYL